MKLTGRHKLATALSLTLMLCFFSSVLMSPATAQDMQAAAKIDKKRSSIPVGRGEISIKRTDTNGFTFKLTDPETGTKAIAKGGVSATQNGLDFQMKESDGRLTTLNARRIDDHTVALHLETAGVAADVVAQHPGGDASNSGRESKPSLQPVQYNAYLKAVSESRGLRTLGAALEVTKASSKIGANATILAKIIRLAQGGKPHALGDVSTFSGTCWDWSGLNYNMCMIDYENPIYCAWDTVLFFIACVLD